MNKDDNRPTSVYLRDLDPDVRQRAEAEARRRGYSNLVAFVRRQVYQLAGDA